MKMASLENKWNHIFGKIYFSEFLQNFYKKLYIILIIKRSGTFTILDMNKINLNW